MHLFSVNEMYTLERDKFRIYNLERDKFSFISAISTMIHKCH